LFGKKLNGWLLTSIGFAFPSPAIGTEA